MRIIAGKYRSRQLKSLKGLSLRPTSDRLRETLFNVLGELVVGSRFIDVFAGTGAVGIEALSRGAQEAFFIEKHAATAALIRKNLESLQIKEGVRVLTADAMHGLEIVAEQNWPSPGIVFLDPPYAHATDYECVLGFLGAESFLVPNSVVIAEHRRNFQLPESMGALHQVRVLRQGDATLTFYRLQEQTS
jgi:16S rRNA (guanine966-N2)-methyltransferase